MSQSLFSRFCEAVCRYVSTFVRCEVPWSPQSLLPTIPSPVCASCRCWPTCLPNGRSAEFFTGLSPGQQRKRKNLADEINAPASYEQSGDGRSILATWSRLSVSSDDQARTQLLPLNVRERPWDRVEIIGPNAIGAVLFCRNSLFNIRRQYS